MRIDDRDTRITYFPSDRWTEQPGCTNCTIKPDGQQAFQGTWHDTTRLSSDTDPLYLEVKFAGTSVRVFNILCNQQSTSFQPTTTNLDFFLDGEWVNTFTNPSGSGSDDFTYNFRVFQLLGLDNVEHVLRVQATPNTDSFILFDYVEYTFEPPDIPSPSTTTTSSTTTATSTSITFSTITTTSTDVRRTTFTTSDLILTSSTTTSLTSTAETQSGTSSISPATLSPTQSPTVITPSSDSQTQTTSEPPTSSSSSVPSAVPVGLIAGATAGAIGTLVFLMASIILLRRRARSSQNSRLHRKKPNSEDHMDHHHDTLPNESRDMDLTPSSPPGSSVLLIGDWERSRQHMSYATTRSPGRLSSDVSYLHNPESSPHATPAEAESSPYGPYYCDQDSMDVETAVASSFLHSRRSTGTIPPMPTDEKAALPVGSPPGAIDPFTEMLGNSRPLPQRPGGEDAGRRESAAESGDTTTTRRGSTLHAQVAALQAEVARLRSRRQDVFVDSPPPRYDQV
ncbi:hypothetical protein C8Q74DRAFT_1214422 [Fomes fomentarius]|nr:hypothetical protein C8Q74DRAFT_1214422 [Fomes fomentarius]